MSMTPLPRSGATMAGIPSSPQVWKKDWVVHAQPAGRGDKVLDYLGRYVFRIALTNSRLEQIENGQVTFRYRDIRSQKLRRVTLPTPEFIGRFLQHVLPRGCAKVRYYGIWAGSCRQQLEQARALLSAKPPTGSDPCTPVAPLPAPVVVQTPPGAAGCPHCKIGHLIVIEVLLPQRKFPP